MSQSQKLAPGPAGTSCLTCKRRHKKCDLRRPVCERCETGGFECLGYSHNSRLPTQPPRPPKLRRILPKQGTASSLPTRPVISSSASPEVGSSDCDGEATPSSQGNENNLPSAPSSHCLDDQFASTTQPLDLVDTRPNSGTLMTRNHQPLAAHPPAKRALGPTSSLRSLFGFYTQIPYVPYHLSRTLLDGADFEDYVTSYCDRMMERACFKPGQAHLAQMRSSFISRLRASSVARWIVLINARICESLFNGDASQNKAYDLWLCRMEQALRSALAENLASSETQNRQGNCLQVILLKTMISHTSSMYQVLRSATPTFLQILFSEPTLWPSNCDPTSVPLANVIASRRNELMYFALGDITAAMALGLPQQVEYNTSLVCPQNGSVPHEWMHCTPIEFQIILAEINACRDKSLNARDWKEIEHRLITWQARPSGYDAYLESWVVVAWFAVQESWRHTLLAYLYMAVCGAFSDDLRIQSSIRQIFLVIGTVKKQESSGVNVPFFIQLLMAGICARSEKHRSLARHQLANVSHATPQLMRCTDFVPVLDHLWHGAAAGGRPIKWDDYIRSREAVLPVLM